MRTRIVCSIVAAVMPLSTGLLAKERAGAESPRTRRLALTPARFDAAAQRHALFASPENRTAGDAAVHYDKAAHALPSNLDEKQVYAWLGVPLADLPLDDVERVLQRAQASLEHLRRGAACKDCTWPPFTPGTMPANLRAFRKLTFLLCLETRLHVAQGRYDDALATLQVGVAAGKHIGEAPSLVQGNVGLAMVARTLRCVEEMAQTPGSPNLYTALQALPRPLVDLEIPIATELKSLESNKQYNFLTRRMMRRQLEESYTRVRQMMRRLDATNAARQNIEALRHYAATHANQLPVRLSDITDIVAPNNPVTGKPFPYRRQGAQSVLETTPPKGGRPADAIRYEITIAQ